MHQKINEENNYKKIPVIIPSLEPSQELLNLIEGLKIHGVKNIIILNDGSSTHYDYFFEVAKKNYGCIILRHYTNLGKGRSLKDAFNYYLTHFAGITGVVTADSDGQHTPFDILRCMEALENNPEKLCLGVRNFDEENVPYKSKFGNKLTKKIMSYLCGVKVADTQTGLRGIPNKFLKECLSIQGERFEYETNMLIETKDRVEILEIPIETVYESKNEHITHFNPITDSIKIYKIFAKIFFKYIFSSLSSSGIDLFLFWSFCNIFQKYSSILYLTFATILARVLSATYNYLINYSYVFGSKGEHSRTSFKYLSLAIVQMTLSAGFVTVANKYLPVAEVIVKIMVDTILFFVSYWIQHEWVFKDEKLKER